MGNISGVSHENIMYMGKKYSKQFGQVYLYQGKYDRCKIIGIKNIGTPTVDIDKHKNLQHPNLVNVITHDQQFTQIIGMHGLMNSKLKFYFQNTDLPNDLDELIQDRYLDKNYFNEDEIWKIAEEVLVLIDYLQNNGVSIGNVEPMNIYYNEKTKQLKMFDTQIIFGVTGAYSIILNCDHRRPISTPEVTYVVKTGDEAFLQKFKHKSDIFSFGLTLIQIATLEQSINLFDVSSLQMHLNIMETRQNFIRSRYSAFFYDFVQKCINLDPRSRPSAQQLLIQLKKAPSLRNDIAKRASVSPIPQTQSTHQQFTPSRINLNNNHLKSSVNCAKNDSLNKHENLKNSIISNTQNPKRNERVSVSPNRFYYMPQPPIFQKGMGPSAYASPINQKSINQLVVSSFPLQPMPLSQVVCTHPTSLYTQQRSMSDVNFAPQVPQSPFKNQNNILKQSNIQQNHLPLSALKTSIGIKNTQQTDTKINPSQNDEQAVNNISNIKQSIVDSRFRPNYNIFENQQTPQQGNCDSKNFLTFNQSMANFQNSNKNQASQEKNDKLETPIFIINNHSNQNSNNYNNMVNGVNIFVQNQLYSENEEKQIIRFKEHQGEFSDFSTNRTNNSDSLQTNIPNSSSVYQNQPPMTICYNKSQFTQPTYQHQRSNSNFVIQRETNTENFNYPVVINHHIRNENNLNSQKNDEGIVNPQKIDISHQQSTIHTKNQETRHQRSNSNILYSKVIISKDNIEISRSQNTLDNVNQILEKPNSNKISQYLMRENHVPQKSNKYMPVSTCQSLINNDLRIKLDEIVSKLKQPQ